MSYFKGCKVIIGCYDVSDKTSFEKLVEMTEEGLAQLGPKALQNVIIFLVGTKSDQGINVTEDDVAEYMEQNGVCKHFITSAKTGEGVKETFESIIDEILQ